MLIIRTSAAMARALDSPIGPTLKHLLAVRRDQLVSDGFHELGDIATFIIAQPGDTVAAVEAQAGIPIAANIINGSHYPNPTYQPNWEACVYHDGTGWEATLILSDDGAGVILIVMDQPGVDPTLLALCRHYAPM